MIIPKSDLCKEAFGMLNRRVEELRNLGNLEIEEIKIFMNP
jgi:hypothetical protein